jgi:7-cyano-7-deazaguanine reductase
MSGHPADYEQVLAGLRALSPDDRRKCFAALKREREASRAELLETSKLLPNSHWSQAPLLQRIPNPTTEAYEQKVYMPELTFLGVADQPDFGEVLLTFYPREWTIELKSLKQYKDAFRGSMISYERLANVMFDDIMHVFEPIRLRLMLKLRPRGGISSSLTIDSDWKIRGGQEHFSDWTGNVDTFGFNVQSAARL